MKRTLIALTLIGGIMAAPAAAGPLEDQFFQMDTSRDGSISRSEYVAFQTNAGKTERQANFAFDNTAGSDGRISLNEFRAGPAAYSQQSSTSQSRTTTSTRQSTPRRAPPPRRTSSGGGS